MVWNTVQHFGCLKRMCVLPFFPQRVRSCCCDYCMSTKLLLHNHIEVFPPCPSLFSLVLKKALGGVETGTCFAVLNYFFNNKKVSASIKTKWILPKTSTRGLTKKVSCLNEEVDVKELSLSFENGCLCC